MAIGGSGSGSDKDPELRLFNSEQEKARQKQAEDLKTQDDANRKLMTELEQRLKMQQNLFGQHRLPDGENRVGGMAGKFLHLAELQPESLAGMVLMQYIVFIISILVGKTHAENVAIYNKAKDAGLAYDPSNPNQKIYKFGDGGKIDFNNPYQPGEKIPTAVIYANGFFPEPDVTRSFQMECMKFLEQQGGPQMVPQHWLEELYGVKKAEKLKQGGGESQGISQEDRMAAGLLNRPAPTPKPGK